MQMEKENFFVVLQNTIDGGRTTIYPEVHYIYEDDGFSPELDALERQNGDISVLCDLDDTGRLLKSCRSISPEWQVVDASLQVQALDHGQQSRLLCITGSNSRTNADLPELRGTFNEQVARSISLVDQLKQRNAEIKQALEEL